MEDIFDPATAAEIRTRICSITAASPRQWGKMSAAQMLEHCARGTEMASGERRVARIFFGRIIGRMIKPMVMKEGVPFRPNSPTAPELRTGEDVDLDASRAHLLDVYDRFIAGGPQQCTTHPHPFFGPLKPEEWSKLMQKHLDHHLRQFSA